MLTQIKTYSKGGIYVSISFAMLSAVSFSKRQSLGTEIIRNNLTESPQHSDQDVGEGRVCPEANDIWLTLSYKVHYNFLSTSKVTSNKKKAEVSQQALGFCFTESKWVPFSASWNRKSFLS